MITSMLCDFQTFFFRPKTRRKAWKIFLTVSAFLVTVQTLYFAFLAFAYIFPHHSLSSEEYRLEMQNMGYNVWENKEYKEKTLVSSLSGTRQGTSLIATHLTYDSDTEARRVFYKLQREVDEEGVGRKVSEMETKDSYKKYTLTDKNWYVYLSCVNDTVFFVKGPVQNKREVQKIAKALGQ